MKQKVNSKSFVIQGSILAIAGILVRIIGLIYRIPLNRILGTEGIDYYSSSFDIYNILILLSSQSLPLSVSKIVAEKLSKNEFRNSRKVFKGAMIYAVILGVAFGGALFIGSHWLAVTAYQTPGIELALKALAPTITVTCILGVMRGYFQGMSNMVPTAISQIFEQIINAIVSIVAATELTAIGLQLSKASKFYIDSAETTGAALGALGGTLGTLFGAITALIVMAIIFFINNKKLQVQIYADNNSNRDSYSKIIKVIIFTITPVLISTTIYNISNLLDNPIFKNIMALVFKVGKEQRSEYWGVYSGYYRVLTTMPIAIASALSTAIVPSLVRSFTQKNSNEVKLKVNLALKFSMIVAFPCGMGLSVLGGPIVEMLFGYKENLSETMMLFSIFTVVVFSLSTTSNAILQGIDKLKVPIKNSGISLIIHLVILPVLLIVFKLNIYAVVIGDILFAFVVCILNSMSIQKYLGYKQEFVYTFIKPFLSSVIMGVFAYFAYKGLIAVTESNLISVIFAIIIAVLIYGISLIITKTVSENELISIPKGVLIVKLLKKIKLL